MKTLGFAKNSRINYKLSISYKFFFVMIKNNSSLIKATRNKLIDIITIFKYNWLKKILAN